MSEWRADALTGHRVILSPERALRPAEADIACPFCAGNERETPPELLAVRDSGNDNAPDWLLRVVPNRFGAVRPQVEQLTILDADRRSWPADGTAEVFLETPDHQTHFHRLPLETIHRAAWAWRERLRFHHALGRFAYAIVFKNQGPSAGASLSHCHSQLIATRTIPDDILRELAAFERDTCPLCDRIATERDGPRHLTTTPYFAVVCPYAPRFPGETWFVPHRHVGCFRELDDRELHDFADVLKRVLLAMESAYGSYDYNIVVKSAPLAPLAGGGTYHLRIEILPRTIYLAGWEWGTGVAINPLLPETAAAKIRARLES
jgi:UDPglucose--hexose-1-phosphate uridylyltransferase